jgi:hypothetical protein
MVGLPRQPIKNEGCGEEWLWMEDKREETKRK